MNHVYFIGAGPGDPGCLTLAGARALQRASAVFAPPPFDQLFADFLADKSLHHPFSFYFEELRSKVADCLVLGDVAFLVPGDLTFYSPFQPLVDAFGDQAEVIPGVGTANLASARLKKTLDLPGVCSRTVLVSPRTLGDGPDAPGLANLAGAGVTLLIYMNNRPLPELVEELVLGYGRDDVPIALLHRLGLPGERIVSAALADVVAAAGDFDYFNLSEPHGRPALTLVVVGETLTSATDGSWWDYRREHIWSQRESP